MPRSMKTQEEVVATANETRPLKALWIDPSNPKSPHFSLDPSRRSSRCRVNFSWMASHRGDGEAPLTRSSADPCQTCTSQRRATHRLLHSTFHKSIGTARQRGNIWMSSAKKAVSLATRYRHEHDDRAQHVTYISLTEMANDVEPLHRACLHTLYLKTLVSPHAIAHDVLRRLVNHRASFMSALSYFGNGNGGCLHATSGGEILLAKLSARIRCFTFSLAMVIPLHANWT